MQESKNSLSDALPTALLVLGAALVSAGIGWMFPPAGVVAAGCFLLAAGWLLVRGGGGDGG